MDRSRALHELPATDAVALRLRDGGFGDHVIAVAVDTEDVQVPALLRIAEAKLAKLIAMPISPSSDGPTERRISPGQEKADPFGRERVGPTALWT